MPEVRDRLERIGSQVHFPEDAFERLTRRRKRRETTRRLATVALALIVAVAGIGVAVTTLRRATKLAEPRRQAQTPLWPDVEQLSMSDLLACCSTPETTAENFARTVLRWRLPVIDTATPAPDSLIVHRDCRGCFAVTLRLQRPTGTLPAWSVVKVDSDGMSFDLPPGALLQFGSTARAQVTMPEGASLIAGLGLRSSCGEAVPAPSVVRVTQGSVAIRIAAAGLDASCLAAQGQFDGYLFLTQLSPGAAVEDPLARVGTSGTAPGRVPNLAAVAVRFTAKSVDVQPSGIRNGPIAYTIVPDPSRGGQSIISIEADGTGRRQLASLVDGCCLSWSPDGKQIVFDHGLGKGQGELVVMNANGTGAHVITSDPSVVYNDPVWSPDGAHIAFFSGDGHLDVIDAGGGNLRTVFEKPPECAAESPAWSPDSARLVYVLWCDTGPGISTIEVVGVDGTGRTTLIGPADQIPDLGPGAVEYSTPAWSPDGSRILFVVWESVRTGFQSQVYVMNADGTGVIRLTAGARDSSPVWSPDGTLIAFISNRTGSSQIYVMNADGAGLTLVTDEANGTGNLAWLPLIE